MRWYINLSDVIPSVILVKFVIHTRDPLKKKRNGYCGLCTKIACKKWEAGYLNQALGNLVRGIDVPLLSINADYLDSLFNNP